MARSVELKNYMVPHPVTVTPETSIIEASKIIIEQKISGVCVVDTNNNLLGILSEMDCLRAVVEKLYNARESDAGTVAEVMTKNVEVCDPEDQITNVATQMLEHKQRRRPILVNNKLVGQVTCRQILKAIEGFAIP